MAQNPSFLKAHGITPITMPEGVATMIHAAVPIAGCYRSYFDNTADAIFAIGRDEEIERLKHEFDTFEAVYNRLVGAAIVIDDYRALTGVEPHGIVVTMLDIMYHTIEVEG
jgi:hypothetical protein